MQGKQLQAGEKGEDLRDVRGGMGRIWWEDKDGEDSNPGSLDPDLMHFTPGLATEDCGIRQVWFASCVTLGDSLAVLGGLWEVGRALHSPGGLEAEQVQGMGLLRDTVSPASVSISQPLAASAVWRRSVSCLSALTLTQTKTCAQLTLPGKPQDLGRV